MLCLALVLVSLGSFCSSISEAGLRFLSPLSCCSSLSLTDHLNLLACLCYFLLHLATLLVIIYLSICTFSIAFPLCSCFEYTASSVSRVRTCISESISSFPSVERFHLCMIIMVFEVHSIFFLQETCMVDHCMACSGLLQ